MVSLDIVAMLPSIPLDLVRKAISNRWDQIKSHKKVD